MYICKPHKLECTASHIQYLHVHTCTPHTQTHTYVRIYTILHTPRVPVQSGAQSKVAVRPGVQVSCLLLLPLLIRVALVKLLDAGSAGVLVLLLQVRLGGGVEQCVQVSTLLCVSDSADGM